MKIKGFIKNSFLDWDGKISSIIFTGGCNFKCPFCYNKDLVLDVDKMDDVSEDFIFEYLTKNRKWVDGVVISGGEPSLHSDLLDFISKIKAENFLIKLDTNGYNPDVLEKVLKLKLIDYVAMDIKTALNADRYSQAVGVKNIEIEKIKKSINLLFESNIDFEFRTTLCPSFVGLDDLLDIAKVVKNKKWAWQNFRHSGNLLDERMNQVAPYIIKQIDDFETVVKSKIENINLIRR
jgi:pyruvate formate lyase activating enzyme